MWNVHYSTPTSHLPNKKFQLYTQYTDKMKDSQFQTDFWQNMIQQRKPEPVFFQGSVSTFFMGEF